MLVKSQKVDTLAKYFIVSWGKNNYPHCQVQTWVHVAHLAILLYVALNIC